MDNATLTWLDRVQDERGKLSRWAILLKRFSFDIENVPGKKNQLPDTLSRLPGNEVFREDPEEADAFLPPTWAKPEEENFVANLGAADMQQQIVDSQSAEPELHEDHLRTRAFPLRKTQELKQADGAFALYEPGRPPYSTSRGAYGTRSCATTTRTPSPATRGSRRPRGLYRSGCTGRTSESAFGGTCVLAAIALPAREDNLSTQGHCVRGKPTRHGTAWQSI
jgi:hypothetical protein